MALSSEDRRQLESRAARWRYKAEHEGTTSLWPTQRMEVAVADHLAACEALLREIRVYGIFPDDRRDDWRARFLALLGPVATKEGAVRWNTSIDGESPGRDVVSRLVED